MVLLTLENTDRWNKAVTSCPLQTHNMSGQRHFPMPCPSLSVLSLLEMLLVIF